ncbi:MAG TPA: lipid II flippase MurJ [Bryobacteraceae bacterium]|nr:lipid II flippase MurJ [Bryobacteraceae bacterium]
MRGGLTLAGGVLTGNLIGVLRVAITAYFLGTHSRADSLAVAMGPIDTLNSVLANSMLFAFVPMLTARTGLERTALFLQLRRVFAWVFVATSVSVVAAAPWLMRALAPGLSAESFGTAVSLLRILALSTMAGGAASLYWALLYTERRFGPTAFYQATLNVCTVVAAVSLWQALGVYAFAVGYTAGACVQLALVHFAARRSLQHQEPLKSDIRWGDILAKPAFFMVYAAGLGLNITFTRAYATHAGSGMAAAMEYCLRGVGVPLALLVNPVANSLLPEIARLKSALRLREAFRLIDRTMALAGLVAVACSGFAMLLRTPAIALLFERGSFTPESTKLVAAVFLGLAPTLIGWSLIEITSRSLFALDRPWPPVLAAFIPVLVNATLTLRLGLSQPEFLGIGASAGTLAGFAVLFLIVHWNRKRWLGV